MNTEEPLVEVVHGSLFETGPLLHESAFTVIQENESIDKAHCLLYENCIIIKAKVFRF
jgi:hypothetical protein